MAVQKTAKFCEGVIAGRRCSRPSEENELCPRRELSEFLLESIQRLKFVLCDLCMKVSRVTVKLDGDRQRRVIPHLKITFQVLL